MSDKKMNDFPAAADGAFVYAEDANGNQIKISKADLASVVAELLNSKSDVGIKTILPNNGNIAKILQVQQYGRVTILLSHNSYSNTQTVIALVTVYPSAIGDCKPVAIKYLQGNKDESNQYAVKIYSAANTDGSISLFVKTAHYESSGYRVISNYLGEANVVYNVDLPDNAVLI